MTEPTRRRGRPPMPLDKQRSKRAYLSLTIDELMILDAKTNELGLSRMAYLRWKVIEK